MPAIELALLVLANIVGGSSAIMIKASTIHPILQASYRLLFAALFLAPLFFKELKRSGARLSFRLIAPALLPGLALGIHFITWTLGARLTLAGNATVIVTMVPVAMPLFVFMLTRELPRKAEVAGTVVALGGIAILAAYDFRRSKNAPAPSCPVTHGKLWTLFSSANGPPARLLKNSRTTASFSSASMLHVE